ncbi:hypothetical protein JCM10908_003209 [Rhodotorula pacifica]|uniref:uncharacterized protein n=1 Tax=Rhodotorula pacifica TaxID=1495444 RepID=UPI0031725503
MLRSLLLLAAAGASLTLAAPSGVISKRTSPTEPPAVIDLGYARVQGYLNQTDSIYYWHGIRYASADRFQAPRTPAKHTSVVYNATAFGPICFQAAEGSSTLQGKPPVANFTIASQSEDCLYLNVNAPAGACEGSNLPVLVWIHGGGYAAGSASKGSDFSDFIINAGRNIVVVTIQYRLGPFGFLAGQATADFGALNAGLLDQQYALQWVQDHVSKFGGNPSHVTIWGESAGAGSVLNQILANGGNTAKALGLKQPLFQAAIGSSVFLPTQVAYNAPIAENIYEGLVNFVGCGNSSLPGAFACLQATDAATVASAALNLSKAAPTGYWTYVPVVEGQGGFLQDRASLLLAKGSKNLNGLKFLGINNQDEGYIFTDPSIINDTTTDANQLGNQFNQILSGLFPLFTPAEIQSVAAQYPISDAPSKGNTFNRISNIIADSTFVCPTYWTAEAFGSSAWKGIFDYGAATHGSDVAWYQGPIWTRNHSVSAENSFAGSFEGFIQTYDPNNNPATKINPSWPTYDSGEQVLFNTTTRSLLSEADPSIVQTSSISVYGTTQTTKCDFWRGSISVNAGL